jgi:tetratricopeptide (TPR) repeat protein/O-antigen ligase
VFTVLLFMAGMGGIFFRMARDNDDLIRTVLVLAVGSALMFVLAAGRIRLPLSLTIPALGYAIATLASCLPAINPPESMKEFIKVGVFVLLYLTLAQSAQFTPRSGSPGRRIPLAIGLALAGIILGRLHAYDLATRYPLWSDPQIVMSLADSAILCAAFVLLLSGGTVRQSVLTGLKWMAAVACVIGILQFYDVSPLSPWDPPAPYKIWLRGWVADLVAPFTAGVYQQEAGGALVLVLPRILGIYGNPDFFAPYIVQFIPLTIALAVLDPAARVRMGILSGFLLLTLWLTAVWGAFLALIIVLPFSVVLVAWVGGRIDEDRAKRLSLGILAAGALLVVMATWTLHASGRKSSAISERAVKVLMSMEMWKKAPVAGIGLNDFRTWYPLLQQKARFKFGLPFESLGSSGIQENRVHNDYAQMLAESGVLGTGMFLWFMIAVCAGALKRLRDTRLPVSDRAAICGLLGGVLVILVYALPNFPFHIVSSSATFWILAGLLSSWQSGVSAAPLPTANQNSPGVEEQTDSSVNRSAFAPKRLLKAAAWGTVAFMSVYCVQIFYGRIQQTRAENCWQRKPLPDVNAADVRDAVKYYERAVKLDPDQAQLVFDYGAICFNNAAKAPEYFPRAEGLFREAARIGYFQEGLYYGLGVFAEKRGDIKEAYRNYSAALGLNERHGYSRNARYLLFTREMPEAEKAVQKKQYARARDLYLAAFRKNPANWLAEFQYGSLSVKPFEDTKTGIPHIRAAAQASGVEPTFYLQLGRSLAWEGQLHEARRALATAVMLDATSAEARNELATVDRLIDRLPPGAPRR